MKQFEPCSVCMIADSYVCMSCRDDAKFMAASIERARIVAWLRRDPTGHVYAKQIENKEHLK